MNFFEKRPLSIILCILLGGFSLFSLLLTVTQIILTATALLLMVLLICFIKRAGYFPAVCAITLLVSFGLSFLYFNVLFPVYKKTEKAVRMEGKVCSVVYEESFGTKIKIKTNSISDINAQRATLFVSFDTYIDFEIDDKISLYGKIEELEDDSIGFSEKQYYEPRGVQGIVYNPENLLIESEENFSLRRTVARARERLNDYILNSADKEIAGTLLALVTGEKDSLPAQMHLDFKRIGLSHILAISGMHLAILTAGLHFLLSLFGAGKRLRSLIAMVFVVFYMTITGFSVSVLRAGLMLLISNLLFLFAKTKDPFTNLMISISVICLISPYALHDFSLLLSFLATFGVLTAVQLFENTPYHISKFKKVLIAVAASFLSSVLAISMTLPLSVFGFQRISYIAPITTLIFSPMIEVFMYLGSIFLLLGAPHFLLFVLNPCYKAIQALAAFFAELPNVYTIADFRLTEVITVVFYLILLIFFVFSIKHKKASVLILSVLFCLIFATGYINTESVLKNDHITYRSDTFENEALVAIHEGKATAINLTKNTESARSAFYQWLDEEKILSLDNLCFAQYTDNLPKAIRETVSSIPIKTIYLPTPKNEEEEGLLLEIDEILASFRCTYETLDVKNSIDLGGLSLYSVYRAHKEDGFRVILSLQSGGEYYTYISKGAIEEFNTDLANYVMSVSRGLIFGCRGRAYTENYILEFASKHTDILIFSSDDVLIDGGVYDEYEKRARILYKPTQVLLAP